MSKAEQNKAQMSKEQIAQEIAKIKANSELLNALKADTEISANLSELKAEYHIEINRYNDIHFKKAMLQSLKHFANLNQLQKLRMRFEKDRIVIESAK